MKIDIVVTRHPAAAKFVAAELGGQVADRTLSLDTGDHPYQVITFDDGRHDIPVESAVDAQDVRDKNVIGNLPLHLAALARQVIAIEFDGSPPRGQEYGLAEMTTAGARLVGYYVTDVDASSGTTAAQRID